VPAAVELDHAVVAAVDEVDASPWTRGHGRGFAEGQSPGRAPAVQQVSFRGELIHAAAAAVDDDEAPGACHRHSGWIGKAALSARARRDRGRVRGRFADRAEEFAVGAEMAYEPVLPVADPYAPVGGERRGGRAEPVSAEDGLPA